MKKLPPDIERALNLLIDHTLEPEFESYLENSPLAEKDRHIFFSIKTVADHLEKTGQLDRHNSRTLDRIRGPLQEHLDRYAWSCVLGFAERLDQERAKRLRVETHRDHERKGKSLDVAEADNEPDWSR